MRRLKLCLVLLLGAPALAGAQSPVDAGRSVTGSYARPGCALQVAPVAADTVRLQIECNRGAPGYNLGFLDERLPIRADMIVYSRTQDGPCRITIEFRGARAIVTEDGTDITCGFGAGVSVGGTYRRTSRTPPPFDLSPCG